MSKWIEVGNVEDIPQLGARVVKLPEYAVAVFRTGDDKVFAIKDACPHKQGHLSQGIVHGNKVTCPLHNWTISLETGEALGPDEGCTNVFPVRVDKGRIAIEVA